MIVMLCSSKALAECQMKGVNIAGFEFGCVTNVSFFLEHSLLATLICVGLLSRS